LLDAGARLPFRRRLSCLWGAYAAAAAYAKATDGVVFDGESGEVLPPDKAAQAAREIERDLPKLLDLSK
jgi:hypothetical protein